MKRLFLLAVTAAMALSLASCGKSGGGNSGALALLLGGNVNEYNVNLASLDISSGTLVFDSATTSYSVEVANDVEHITVTPTAAEATVTIEVNGLSVTSGTPSQDISLAVGSNTVTVTVTAEDGITTKTYTIAVTRLAGLSNNANLAGLTVSEGTLSPGFAENTTAYNCEVPYTTSSITVTPTVAGINATVTVNGDTVASGSMSDSIGLSTGSNTIKVEVTAEDDTTMKPYTITVTRVTASTNADLSSLTLSAGTLAPGFVVNETSYTAEVDYTVSSITVTPTAAGLTATVTVNGDSVTSGTASGSIPISTGSNAVTVIVTAESGAHKTYTVTVTKLAEPSHNANLGGLSLSAGTLSPGFDGDQETYTAEVAYATTSITVTPTVAGVNATVTVNGDPVASGIASEPIGLSVGSNTLTVVVTAEDTSTKKTYTVAVTRVTASTNANLASLTLSAGTLSPDFTEEEDEYTASVDNATSSLTVTPTAAGVGAAITVNGDAVVSGSASGSIDLSEGENTITVVVTAQSGAYKTYTVVVTRAATGTFTVSGTVKDSSNFSKYTVEIIKTNDTTMTVTQPDSSNNSTWTAELDPGEYYLKIFGTIPSAFTGISTSADTYNRVENLMSIRQYLLTVDVDGKTQIKGIKIDDSYPSNFFLGMGIPNYMPPQVSNSKYSLSASLLQGTIVESFYGTGNQNVYTTYEYTDSRLATKKEYIGTNASGTLYSTTIYTYNADGSPDTEISDFDGTEDDINTTYTYSENKLSGSVRRIGSTIPGEGTAAFTQQLTYDEYDRISNFSISINMGGTVINSSYVYYYNSDDTCHSIERYDDSTLSVTYIFGYTDGYITQFEIDNPESTDTRLGFTLNTNHLPTSYDQSMGTLPSPSYRGTTEYEYNAFGLPTGITYSGTDPDYTYQATYNSDGTQASYSYDQSDGTTNDWYTDFTYDSNGNIDEQNYYTQASTASGTPVLTTTYTWEVAP